MVLNYKRKTLPNYTAEALDNAIEAVKTKSMNQASTAGHFGVPCSSLNSNLERRGRGRRTYLVNEVELELVTALAKYMVAGGWVFLQSDVESIALEMTERFQAHPHFVRQHQTPWLEENIFPVATEREKSTYNKGQPVYRSLFRVR